MVTKKFDYISPTVYFSPKQKRPFSFDVTIVLFPSSISKHDKISKHPQKNSLHQGKLE